MGCDGRRRGLPGLFSPGVLHPDWLTGAESVGRRGGEGGDEMDDSWLSLIARLLFTHSHTHTLTHSGTHTYTLTHTHTYRRTLTRAHRHTLNIPPNSGLLFARMRLTAVCVTDGWVETWPPGLMPGRYTDEGQHICSLGAPH